MKVIMLKKENLESVDSVFDATSMDGTRVRHNPFRHIIGLLLELILLSLCLIKVDLRSCCPKADHQTLEPGQKGE